jgi:hypothetical protein
MEDTEDPSFELGSLARSAAITIKMEDPESEIYDRHDRRNAETI